MFSKKSSAEKGTLYQLKNLLYRTSVPNNPGDNMKAVEDFLLVVLHSHVVAAAKTRCRNVTSWSKKIVDCYV